VLLNIKIYLSENHDTDSFTCDVHLSLWYSRISTWRNFVGNKCVCAFQVFMVVEC